MDETELISFGTILSHGTSFLVVFISFIMRKVFIFLIKLTGYNKNSEEATSTMTWVLVVTFFNYGLLYLFAPWSFRTSDKIDNNTIGGDLITGIYTDFTF